MLTLILGRAGSGKTMRVMRDIKERGEAGERNLLLIVPEQYSHDAERQLCGICSDALSMYGETMSFSRLCRHVFSQSGGEPGYIMDSGGQILVMHRALEPLMPHLKVFGAKGKRTEILEKLLAAVKEFKSLGILPETLEAMAAQASKTLGDKLQDLALIYSAYDALLHQHGCDNSDRLTMLAEQIADSALGDDGHIYFDGFNDFTEQELRVIEELLKKKAEVTICLTCDIDEADSDAFDLPLKTVLRLQKLADVTKTELTIQKQSSDIPNKVEELDFLENHLFGKNAATFTKECKAITIYETPTRYSECEHAAYAAWSLVREGYRWRDISVMARNWDEYGQICENIFQKYDIPFFSSGRADILDKPPIAHVEAALEIAIAGWEYKSVFKYLKSGISGLTAEDCSLLENYVIKWKIRAGMWQRDWTLPPNENTSESTNGRTLERINDLRRLVTKPFEDFAPRIRAMSEGQEKLRALYAFLEETRFPERLEEKAIALEKRGESRLADEYAQLWEIIVNAMEQMHRILGDVSLNAADFKKLFFLALSRYDVGVIPISLDAAALGSMAMSRRRDLKCLIILGATDDNIPMISRGSGALSDYEREELSALGALISSGSEERYLREMNVLYSTITLPSQKLILTYPTGSGERPSFVIKRIASMFNLKPSTLSEEEYMSAAPKPCFELAMSGGEGVKALGLGTLAAAARAYFEELSVDSSAELKAADKVIHSGRGDLSENVAEKLYGSELYLSPSRVERYYSCGYQHFLANGLRLYPRIPNEFDAPAAGTFTHYVLEGVSREIKTSVGYHNASREHCQELTNEYIEKYIREELYGFEGKTPRFIYLFRRLEENVFRIVLDMMEELKASEFEPFDFELNFSQLRTTGGETKPSGLGGTAESVFSSLSGIVDRVDGWLHNGKIYLRVVDYKTGSTQFNLSDLLVGKNMQMLIYLFALVEFGEARYGTKADPAAVLYMPARDMILQLPRSSTDEEIKSKRENNLRRSGLVLGEADIIDAMERGAVKKYLPVKTTKDGISGDSLVTDKQFEVLSETVGYMLKSAAESILSGRLDCVPFYADDRNNACLYCDYRAVCRFDEVSGDVWSYYRKRSNKEVWDMLGYKG